MVRSKFSLIIIIVFLLPVSSAEVEISANGEKDILFVDSGKEVAFTATGLENTTSVLWDFGRDIGGNGTRYSELSNVNNTVHASGRYNITFTAFYDDGNVVNELVVIVNYVETYQGEKEEIVHSAALFFAIAGAELIMSAVLGYWTQQIRKEKVYL